MHDCIQTETIKTLTEFKGATESDIKTLFNLVSTIKNNDLVHITAKIDEIKNALTNRPPWVIVWIITTLSSLLIGILAFIIGRILPL